MEMDVLMMHQKVFKNYLQNICYKKGDLISLFILCLFLNFLYAQFGFENWLHNDVTSYSPVVDNHITMYHDSNIGFLAENDSTKIYTHQSGFKYQLLFNQTKVSLEYFDRYEKFLVGYNLLEFDYVLHSKNIKTAIEFQQFGNLVPFFSLTLHNNNNPSYQMSIEWNVSNKIDFIYNNTKQNSSYDLIFQYDDFLFDINQIEKSSTLQYIELRLKFNRLKFNFMGADTKYTLNNNEHNINHKILLPNHSDQWDIFKANYRLKLNRYLNMTHTHKKKNMQLSFNNDDVDFIIINRLDLHINKFDINYLMRSKYFNLTMGFEYMNLDYFMSARLRTSYVSDSFEDSFGAPIINNKDTGLLKSKRIYVQYNRSESWIVHFSYIYDKLDFNFRNTLISLFGFPIDIEYDQLKYKRKEAIIIGGGYTFKFKRNIIKLTLNQHIPLKLVSIDEEIGSGGAESSSKRNKDYGGGVFKIKFYRLI